MMNLAIVSLTTKGTKKREAHEVQKYYWRGFVASIMFRGAMVKGLGVPLLMVGLMATIAAQAPPRPAFEVASVKKLAERIELTSFDVMTPSAAFHYPNATVASLILFAYDIQSFVLVGGPAWMRSDLFEINARAAAVASLAEKRRMMQSLLAERFKLVVRRDKQEMAHSELLLARSDRRLGPNFTDCPDPNAPPPPPTPD